MSFSRQTDGTYRLPRSRTAVAEIDILAAAEHILQHRLHRDGVIKNPAETFEYLRVRIGHLPHEEFHAVWLDQRHRVLATERLFNGTIDGTVVHPREVVRRAMEINAAAVIFAHNHPSGVCEPSDSDRFITNTLRNALELIEVRVLDHVIVGAGVPVSLAQRGAL